MHTSPRSFARPFPLLTLIFAALILAVAGCGSDDSKGDGGAKQASSGDTGVDKAACEKILAANPDELEEAPPAQIVDEDGTYTATLETSKGTMVAELDAQTAPNAVANFVFLARKGYYDGVPFHRVIKGFMVQTGDPTGTGSGGPKYTIEGDEVSDPYERGTLAMANTGTIDSASSQFFIVHQDYQLDPIYSIFGKVTKGLEALDKIATTKVNTSPTGEPSVPAEKITLDKVTVEGPALSC
jgi:cyclophilin family peptidyl-prolyl cis-trans isomerase